MDGSELLLVEVEIGKEAMMLRVLFHNLSSA
jgi:hypothetical protein